MNNKQQLFYEKEYNVGEIFEYENDCFEVLETSSQDILKIPIPSPFHSIINICTKCGLLWLKCLPCRECYRKDKKDIFYRKLSINEIRKHKINKLNL